MSKSYKNKPKRTQMHPKRTPESFQDQRCDQRNPEKVSRRGPTAPEAPQRPTKAKVLNSYNKVDVFKKNHKIPPITQRICS